MEKRTPHCPLAKVNLLIESNKVRATYSAFRGAVEVGIDDLAGMCNVVKALTRQDFYKSMTTHADHTTWQDVWHGRTPEGIPLYVKLTVIDDVLIVSFKEL